MATLGDPIGSGARALDVGRLRWLLLALVLALAAAIGLVLSVAIRSASERTLETAQRQAAALARTLEAHTARSLGAAGGALRALTEALEGRGLFAGLDPASFLRDRLDLVPGGVAAAWLDADGRIALGVGSPIGDWAALAEFAAHRAAESGVRVSTPSREADDLTRTIVLSRRLSGANGEFAGVVALAIEGAYFAAYYASIDVGAGGAISMWRDDGKLLVRHPHSPSALGRTFADQPLHAGLRAGSNDGIQRVVSPVDGIARLESWRRVPGLPVAVAIAFGEESYLSPLRETTRLLTAAAAAGAGLVSSLALIVWLQLGRLQRLDGERRVDAERLAQSRRQLRTVIDSVPAIINAKDAQGRYTLMNAYQANLFGVAPRDAIGKRLSDFVDAAFAAEVEARERAMIESGREIRDQAESFPDAQGQMRHVLTSKIPILDRTGAVAQFVSVATDVTRVRAMELAARAAETRLRAALESIPEGFAIFDDDDRLVVANRTYARMFTVHDDPAEIIGLRFDDIVRMSVARGEPPEPGFDTESWVAERLRRHREFGGEPHILKLADGRTISISERRVPGVGLVGVRTDVTRLVEAETALVQARDAAEAANRAKSQFLANMSHELRTPLNAIIGFAEIIEREMFGAVGNPRYVDYARDIAASGRHLVELIGDVLDMSKIEAGRYELEEERVDLRAAIDAAVSIVRGQARQGGVRLDVAPDAPARLDARADGRALRQVLLNLLSNAIKFTPKGGRVEVSLRGAAGGVEIAVTDTGIGIPANELPLVTEPFRQAQGTRGTFGGTGLGLAITRRLVEMHGGRLEIDSVVEKGTRVRVLLPESRLAGIAA